MNKLSEARYLAIIEDQNELICRYLPDNRLTFVNKAFSAYHGKSPEQLINCYYLPTIPEPDLSMVQNDLARISPQNPVVSFTHRIITPAGDVRWQRWTHRGIFNDGGSVAEYQAVGFDITELKLSEHITRASLEINEYCYGHTLDELLTKILDTAEELTDSRIGFFHFYDPDSNTLSLQTWSSRTLATICTAEGKGHRYPIESAGVWCDCIRLKQPVIHNDYASLPERKGLPDGHAPVLREVVIPILRSSRIVAVVGVGNKCTDYTDQDIETLQQLGKSAWNIIERKRAEESLREASIYTRTLIEASLDPLVTISADGRITDVNEASVMATGIPREQLIGTDFSVYFTDPEKARDGYLRVFSEGVVHDYPLAIRHVSGRVTEVMYNASVYKDERGAVKGVFAAARDVTALNRAAESIRQAHAELEHRVSERTAELERSNQLLKKVSFELVWAEEKERERIAGELHDRVGQSLLLAKMKLDSLLDALSSDSLFIEAERASSLLAQSIQDIRTLTFKIRPPILNTSSIDTALEWLCSSVGKDYNLKVQMTNECSQIPLPAEVCYAVYHTVRELLINVAKHSGSDNAHLAIRNHDQTFEVTVSDNGAGFSHPDAHLKHINNGGYGLYNVQQRIEQMGGTVTIESAPGRGTAVTLSVPFAEYSATELEGGEA